MIRCQSFRLRQGDQLKRALCAPEAAGLGEQMRSLVCKCSGQVVIHSGCPSREGTRAVGGSTCHPGITAAAGDEHLGCIEALRLESTLRLVGQREKRLLQYYSSRG